MNIVDIVIILLIAFGAVLGFKAGVIKKTTDFLGMFVIVIASFYLKNYLSVLMYENLPFFNFGGAIKGIDVLNILLYEVIAFVVVFIVLLFALRVVIMLTGLVERILKATIVLSIPSKLLGIVVGAIEMYVYIFLILVVFNLPVFNIPILRDSKMSEFMINNTPILSSVADELTDTYGEVYTIIANKDDKTEEELNSEVLKLLIDKEVITKESAKKLIDGNKIHLGEKNILD